MAKKGLLFGVGINDADYAVKEGARGAAKVYCSDHGDTSKNRISSPTNFELRPNISVTRVIYA